MRIFQILFISVLLCFSKLSFSAQIVPIIWPFSIGSNQATFVRLLIIEANKQQSKYNFILENKPGAGGYLAARYVQDYKGLAIISSSSSFFARPVFYPNESHRVEDFKPVYIECTGQPYLILSSKYKTLDDLRKEERVTIGANLGSITESMARELQAVLPKVKVDIVPYTSGTLAPTQEVLAGRLDLNVDLPAEAMQYIESGKLNVIGTSGTVDHKFMKSFNSQGFKGFAGMTSNYAMYVKSGTDPELIKELHEIFTKAAIASGQTLQDAYNRDFCPGANLSLPQTNDLFDKWVKYWPAALSKLK
jgi:tripartite-type tricarboxylate transporter receptor subunit TctC